MTEQRDPLLDKLFADAQQELVDDTFTLGVMSRLDIRHRRVLIGRLAIVATVIALELLLDSPLQHSLGALTDVLGTPLFEIEHEWTAFLIAPVNSIAGFLGITLVGLHYIYRKLFY